MSYTVGYTRFVVLVMDITDNFITPKFSHC